MPPKAKSSPPTKSQSVAALAESTGHSKADITKVMDALESLILSSVKNHGEFTLNGLVKIKVAQKPARAAREGRNPATGETIMIAAKPAHKVVKVKALKTLKDAI